MPETVSPILIDAPPGTSIDAKFLEASGHPVLLCHGPGEGMCPLVTRGHCPLAARAHGIVFLLDLDREQHRHILDRYRTLLRDDVPIGVVVGPSQAERYAHLLQGLRVWRELPVAGDLDALVAEVDAADLG